MSRKGRNVGDSLPVFQMEILDFSHKSSTSSNALKAGVGLVRKPEDQKPVAPVRTVVRQFKDQQAALRWGNSVGTVIECQKVPYWRYLENISYLRLDQQPLTFKVTEEEFVVNENLEVSVKHEEATIEVDLKSIDNA